MKVHKVYYICEVHGVSARRRALVIAKTTLDVIKILEKHCGSTVFVLGLKVVDYGEVIMAGGKAKK